VESQRGEKGKVLPSPRVAQAPDLDEKGKRDEQRAHLKEKNRGEETSPLSTLGKRKKKKERTESKPYPVKAREKEKISGRETKKKGKEDPAKTSSGRKGEIERRKGEKKKGAKPFAGRKERSRISERETAQGKKGGKKSCTPFVQRGKDRATLLTRTEKGGTNTYREREKRKKKRDKDLFGTSGERGGEKRGGVLAVDHGGNGSRAGGEGGERKAGSRQRGKKRKRWNTIVVAVPRGQIRVKELFLGRGKGRGGGEGVPPSMCIRGEGKRGGRIFALGVLTSEEGGKERGFALDWGDRLARFSR